MLDGQIDGVWLLWLSVIMKVGVASMPASQIEKGVAYVPASQNKGGVAYVLHRINRGGASVPVN